MVDRLTQLDPLKFLSSPGLWIGLIVAAGFIAAAIQQRRYRGPL
jgi:ABC-2 type transport system permease protein